MVSERCGNPISNTHTSASQPQSILPASGYLTLHGERGGERERERERQREGGERERERDGERERDRERERGKGFTSSL